eukprot:8937372-Alexandrium_andersonii.AAC.1
MCKRCRARVPAKRLRAWFEEHPACNMPALWKPAEDDTARPVGSLLFGGRAMHGTHRIYIKRGLVWCSVCGAYAAKIPAALCKPCSGHPCAKARER